METIFSNFKKGDRVIVTLGSESKIGTIYQSWIESGLAAQTGYWNLDKWHVVYDNKQSGFYYGCDIKKIEESPFFGFFPGVMGGMIMMQEFGENPNPNNNPNNNPNPNPNLGPNSNINPGSTTPNLVSSATTQQQKQQPPQWLLKMGVTAERKVIK